MFIKVYKLYCIPISCSYKFWFHLIHLSSALQTSGIEYKLSYNTIKFYTTLTMKCANISLQQKEIMQTPVYQTCTKLALPNIST